MDVEIVSINHLVEDTNCPDEEGPFHMWQCDGPFDVVCDNCGAEGSIVQISAPE